MDEKNAKWHRMTPEAVIQQLHTNAACGLSRKAARSRFKKQGANTVFDEKKSTDTELFKLFAPDSAFLLMVLALLLSAFFLSAVSFITALIILAACVLLFVALFRRIRKNERRIFAYRIPTVHVIRDGKMMRISARRVVRGDLLVLHKGDVVPCDCRLLSSQSLRVMTLISDDTGRAAYRLTDKNAQTVYPYNDSTVAPNYENMLYGASEIFDGSARAIAVETGEFTFVGAMESLHVPSEMGAGVHSKNVLLSLKPFLRIYGLLMLVMLVVLSVVGMLFSPKGMGIADIFLPICILCGAASPMILMLYFHMIGASARVDCMHGFPPNNRAVIKSATAVDRLSSVTDLLVVGHRASSDGVSHFHAAMIGRGIITPEASIKQPALMPLSEAFLLLHDSLSRMLTKDAQYAYSDSVFLSEMLSASDYDEAAMRIRLLHTSFCKGSEHGTDFVDVKMKERSFRLIFTEQLAWIDRCVVYEDGLKRCAISPQLRDQISRFLNAMHADAAKTIAVIRRDEDGVFSFVGIAAQREQMQAVLPSVAEELAQCGVRVTFFLGEKEEGYAMAARLPGKSLVCSATHPHLASEYLEHYRSFVGFEKEELLHIVKSMTAQGRRVALLVGNAEDRLLLRGSPLVISCEPVDGRAEERVEQVADAFEEDGRENSKRASQVLLRHADILIGRAERFAGGLAAVLQTLSECRTVRLRMRLFLNLLYLTQFSVIAVSLLSILLGLGIQSGYRMIYVGFYVEMVALIWVLSMQLPQNRLRKSVRFDESVILKVISSPTQWITNVASAGTTVFYTAILYWCGAVDAEQASAYLFVSLVALQALGLYRTVYRIKDVKFRIFSYVPALLLILPVAALILLSFIIPSIGLASWSLVTLLSLPLMPTVYILLCVFLPFFHRTAK